MLERAWSSRAAAIDLADRDAASRLFINKIASPSSCADRSGHLGVPHWRALYQPHLMDITLNRPAAPAISLPRPKVVLSVNAAWNVMNFRVGLIKGLLQAGYDVVVVAPDDGYGKAVQALGVRYVPLALDRKGKNPFKELTTALRYYAVLRAERPAAYLGFTVKPNVYGSLACHWLGIPVINNIAGLGTAFAKPGVLATVVRKLYTVALRRSDRVFFQNGEDKAAFRQSNVVTEMQSRRLPGSGVDLTRFAPAPLPASEGDKVRFLLPARLLWDKGVGTYVEALRGLRQRGLPVEGCLLGFVDDGNPGAIGREQIDAWHAEGIVTYLGAVSDVRPILASVDCVVLPSVYKEGVPRALLEAASMGRPLITTDASGCRDAVDDHVSGYLVRPGDANDLAEKMGAIARMPPPQRAAMGLRGREKMERQFDEMFVVQRYLDELQHMRSHAAYPAEAARRPKAIARQRPAGISDLQGAIDTRY